MLGRMDVRTRTLGSRSTSFLGSAWWRRGATAGREAACLSLAPSTGFWPRRVHARATAVTRYWGWACARPRHRDTHTHSLSAAGGRDHPHRRPIVASGICDLEGGAHARRRTNITCQHASPQKHVGASACWCRRAGRAGARRWRRARALARSSLRCPRSAAAAHAAPSCLRHRAPPLVSAHL